MNKSYVGKLVDSWVYEVKDLRMELVEFDRDTEKKKKVKRVFNKKIVLEVRIHKYTENSEDPPFPVSAVEFSVTNKELQIEMTGTDIESLRRAAFAKLDEKFAIKWESYYLVKVERARIYEGLGSGLEFSYSTVYKGTTWDGKFLLKTHRHTEEKIKPWPGVFKDERGSVMACIQDTPENTDALEEFSKRVDTLRKLLGQFLRPDVIMQTLRDMNQLALLPPIEPKGAETPE